MADYTGVLTTLSHALPTGLDATRLAQWRLRNGRSYEQVRADIAAALDGVNSDILSAWGPLVHVTTDDYIEYQDGGGTGDMIDVTDLDRVEAKRGETKGHMIDLREKGDAIGGTEKFFRDARESVITASVAGMVQRGRNTLEKAILTRAMNNTVNAIGSAGYDMPFANASGTVAWTPPAYGGKNFASSHDHFIGYDSGSKNLGDVLTGLTATVHEHGHPGPFHAFVSEADVTPIRALNNYVQPTRFAVDRGGETNGNRAFVSGAVGGLPAVGARSIGWFDSGYGEIELFSTNRIPTGFALVFKSYGVNDPRNPIWVRVHPEVGFGFFMKEIPSFSTTYPVKTIEVRIEYGISVGRDRTNGAVAKLVSGGSYGNPTIS